MSNLLADLQNGRKMLLDGAMGTMLSKKGLGLTGGVNNIENSEVVTEVHQEYIAAGSDIIITNTFSLNRIYADTHNLNIDLKTAILKGVAAARAAVENKAVYILGDIGPTGQMLQPLGVGTAAEFLAAFQEQAELLAAAGVDGFIIETMFDLEEALLAVQACKNVSDLPVLATMTFSTAGRGGRTMMGNKAADCALRLSEAGCAAIGLNCGDVEIEALANIVANLKAAVDLPIIVEANAGKPELVDGEAVYNMPAEQYAQGMNLCLEQGAKILGGCCGTTPEHIAALRKLLKA